MIDRVEVAKSVGLIVHVQCIDLAHHYDQIKPEDTFLITLHVYGLLCYVTDDFIAVTQQQVGDDVRNTVCIPWCNIQNMERVTSSAMKSLWLYEWLTE